MPAPYSNDLRTRVVRAIESNTQSKTEIAEAFSVSISFVRNLWAHYQKTGDVTPKQIGGYTPPKVDKAGEEHLRVWLENESSLTLRQLCDRYDTHFGITMGTSSMERALKRANITVKKKPV